MSPADFYFECGDIEFAARAAGAVIGPVVIYFHGTPGSRFEIDLLHEAAIRCGVRLVAFDRPGYGGTRSTPFDFDLIATASAALLDRVSPSATAGALGHSGGGAFALAAARYQPDRFRVVACAAGVVSIMGHPDGPTTLSDADRHAVPLIESDPAEAARRFAVGFEALRRGVLAPGAASRQFLAAAFPEDAELIKDENVLALLARSATAGLEPGVIGCGWDNVAWVGHWGFRPSDINVPVLLYYGRLDRYAPLSFGRWLHDQLPRSRLTIWDDAGHLGLFSHQATVLEQIASRVTDSQ